MRVHSWTDDLAPRNREPFWLDLVPRHVMNAPALAALE